MRKEEEKETGLSVGGERATAAGAAAAATSATDFLAQQQPGPAVVDPNIKNDDDDDDGNNNNNNTEKKKDDLLPPGGNSNDDSSSKSMMSSSLSTIILPKGTVLYWRFDIGSYWGQVISFDSKTTLYETTWDDGSDNSNNMLFTFSKAEVEAMQSYAQYTLKHIPQQFLKGTPVIRYFANEEEDSEEEEGGGGGGSWWNGLIVDHDTNHNYTIEWKDGTLEQWDPLSTVAMVQDADYFLHRKKKKKKKSSKENQIKIIKNGEKETEGRSNDYDDNDYDNGNEHEQQVIGKTSSHSKMSAGSKKSKKKKKNEKKHNNNNNILDPTSFPPTEEGLAAFLKIIDEGDVVDDKTTTTTTTMDNDDGTTKKNNSPTPPILSNGGNNGNGRQKQSQQRPQQAVYHATNLTIDASTTREFTIPIFEAHSTIDYNVTVDNHDIKFAILWHDPSSSNNKKKTKKSHNGGGGGGTDNSVDTDDDDDDDDSENDDIELVEQRTIYAANTTKPPSTEGDDDDDGDDVKKQQQHTIRGQFALDESIPVPTTLFLEFDNSYSWFRSKTVSYQVTVNSPSSQAMIRRATDAVPLVLQALQEAKTNVALQESVVQTASKQADIVQQDNAGFARQVETRQNLVFQAENAADEADQKYYNAETNLHHQHQLLENQDLYIQEIDSKILDLQRQRAHLIKQKAELEVDIIASKEQLKSYETISSVKRSEAERIKMDMCDLQIEILTRDQQYGVVEKQQSQAESNLQSAIKRMQFLKRQAEELQKRLNNK